MKNELINKLIAGALIAAPLTGFAGNTLYNDNNTGGITLDTQVRIDVDKNTDVVMIDRDDSAANLITKAFVLKHADPYEIRPYVRNMVKAAEYLDNTEDSHVECAKYADGTGVLIVTAEEQKFVQGHNGGLSVEELISKLDQPSITSSSGQKKMVYFAQHESVSSLQEMIDNVVIQSSTNTTDDNKEGIPKAEAAELAHQKEKTAIDNELNALVVYANPYNVDKVKSWLKSIDKQGSNNWLKVTVYQVDEHNSAEMGNDFNDWKNNNLIFDYAQQDSLVLQGGIDGEYIDFLMGKGLAKVYTQAEMVLANGKSGKITKGSFMSRQVEEVGAPNQDLTVNGNHSDTKVVGNTSDRNIGDTEEHTFKLSMKPRKVGKTTILDISADITSLLGFAENGSAITQDSNIDTEVVIDNKVGKYIIGGIEKKEVVEVVNKVPFLGSIPVIGSLFSTEATETKSSQLVVVVESQKVKGNWGLSAEATEAKFGNEEAHERAGKDIETATDQYIFDADKNLGKDIEETVSELKEDVAELSLK